MSEIEKMYENVGLIYCNKCRHDSELDCLYMCESKYPPFTSEKQIELIKWLAFKDYISIISHPSGEYYCECGERHACENSLEECLASLLNNHWQDLTEEEKKQVKGILE